MKTVEVKISVTVEGRPFSYVTVITGHALESLMQESGSLPEMLRKIEEHANTCEKCCRATGLR